MAVSRQLAQGCLLYDFKVSLSAAASSHCIRQAFGDVSVSERTDRHWFQTISDEPSSDLPLVMKDEFLKANTEQEDS